MNVFTNTKKSKKIFIILIALILFNFTCPRIVRAGDSLDWIMVGVGKLFFGLFDGIQSVVDRLFLDEDHEGLYTVSAENVIKGKFILMNPNIFEKITSNDKNYYDYDTALSGRNTLRDTISGWYYALRNLAIVALLSILVYVAIRMILSTVSQDKAKYKMMFKDWLVALCLLFLIHYIMVGILNLSSTITNAIGTSSDSLTQSLAIEIDNKIDEAIKETRANGTDDDYVVETMLSAMADTVIYAAMVIMNVIFIAKYVIRALTIIFLVLLAPITCITYPIDKISDGKAQAYDMWFKEFLYQVIIQPFHLLIYVVLIGSAAELASENLIYAMLCFGVMIPAEKFIKQMFGFKDKLGSPLGSFAGGAIASQLMNSMKSLGKGGSSGKSDSSNKTDDLPPNNDKINLPGTDGSERGRLGDNPNADPNTDPNMDPNADPNADPNMDPNADPNMDPNADPNADPNMDPNADPNTDPNMDPNADPNTDQNTDPNTDPNADSNNQNGSNNQNNQELQKPGRWERAYRAANSRASQHFLKKYGTTKFKGQKVGSGLAAKMAKRGLSSAYKGAKNVGRKAIKGATTLAGAAALGAFGAMFGKGKEMAAVGAALGGKVGGTITNATDKIAGTVEGYVGDAHNAFWDKSKQNDKDKYKEDENNIKLARQNYKKRHNGTEAKGKDLDEELEKMYEMKSVGVDKSQYNDVLTQAEEYQEDGMSEDEAMDTAMTSALQAQQYSAKDFKDEKAMTAAYDELYKQYKPYIDSNKISQEQADKNIRRILEGGAKMKGVKEPALPKTKTERTIDVNRPLPNIPKLLGVSGSSDLTDERLERLNEMTLKLREHGYTDNEIKNIATDTADSRARSIDVMDRYEAKLEFLLDDTVQEDAREYIANDKKVDVKVVTDKEVKTEILNNRLDFFNAGVSKERMNEVRAIDETLYSHHKKSDKEEAINISNKYSTAEMKDVNFMNNAIEDYAKKLVSEHKVSGNGKKEAVERFERAALYKDTEIAHTINVD